MTIFRDLKHIFLYGIILAVLIFVLKWLQWKFLIADNSIEIYTGLTALFFTVLGYWIAKQIVKPKVQTLVVEKEVIIPQPGSFVPDEAELKKLDLSKREYEVLQLMAKGMSNAEMAGHLFLSLSTVKTHASNLYIKMDVKSRTQAIKKARTLRIIE